MLVYSAASGISLRRPASVARRQVRVDEDWRHFWQTHQLIGWVSKIAGVFQQFLGASFVVQLLTLAAVFAVDYVCVSQAESLKKLWFSRQNARNKRLQTVHSQIQHYQFPVDKSQRYVCLTLLHVLQCLVDNSSDFSVNNTFCSDLASLSVYGLTVLTLNFMRNWVKLSCITFISPSLSPAYIAALDFYVCHSLWHSLDNQTDVGMDYQALSNTDSWMLTGNSVI